MSHALTHLDLFSGIGGFSLAAQWAGFRTIGFSEVEPYACRVLAERFPGIPNLGDVRQTANFLRFRGCTIITAGYPCQPDSLAGQRRGTADDRWLWPAARRIVSALRPTWCLCENVFGHVSMGLDGVLTDLESLGYATQPFVVPACAVDARHRRDRVWIVAHAGCELVRLQQVGEPERGDPPVVTDDGAGRTLADAHEPGLQGRNGEELRERAGERAAGARGAFAPHGEPPGWSAIARGEYREWLPEPAVGRVAARVPHRAHRLRGLGNSIVPQVAAQFFRFIAQIESGQ